MKLEPPDMLKLVASTIDYCLLVGHHCKQLPVSFVAPVGLASSDGLTQTLALV